MFTAHVLWKSPHPNHLTRTAVDEIHPLAAWTPCDAYDLLRPIRVAIAAREYLARE